MKHMMRYVMVLSILAPGVLLSVKEVTQQDLVDTRLQKEVQQAKELVSKLENERKALAIKEEKARKKLNKDEVDAADRGIALSQKRYDAVEKLSQDLQNKTAELNNAEDSLKRSTIKLLKFRVEKAKQAESSSAKHLEAALSKQAAAEKKLVVAEEPGKVIDRNIRVAQAEKELRFAKDEVNQADEEHRESVIALKTAQRNLEKEQRVKPKYTIQPVEPNPISIN